MHLSGFQARKKVMHLAVDIVGIFAEFSLFQIKKKVLTSLVMIAESI